MSAIRSALVRSKATLSKHNGASFLAQVRAASALSALWVLPGRCR